MRRSVWAAGCVSTIARQSGIELRREESQGIPFEILELMKLQQD